jgi:hypothetical protein
MIKVYRFYLMNRMRPFIIVPTPSTDSVPKLGKLRRSKWYEKPSFQRTYFNMNGKIVCKGEKPRVMDWYFLGDKLYWFSDKGAHVWEYGKDFTVCIKSLKQ